MVNQFITMKTIALASALFLVLFCEVEGRGIGIPVSSRPQNEEDAALLDVVISRIMSRINTNLREDDLEDKEGDWYHHPTLRGKRPDEKPADNVLPWEMKYFSPMLRGKKSQV